MTRFGIFFPGFSLAGPEPIEPQEGGEREEKKGETKLEFALSSPGSKANEA